MSVALTSCSTSGAHPSAPAASSPSPSGGAAAHRLPRLEVSTAPWRLPRPLSRTVVFVDGSSLVVAGGLEPGDVSTAAVMRIDALTGRRSRLPDLSEPVHDAAGITLRSGDLVVGGGAATSSAAVQRVGAAAGGAGVTGRLPHPRSDVAAASLDGTGYVVGGYDGTTLQQDVLATTDGHRFRVVARLPVPVRYPAVAVVAGALWVVGGRTDSAGTSTTAAVQRVDLGSGRAAVVSRLPTRLSDATAVVVDGQLLICGGDRNGVTATDLVRRLDPATGRVRPAGRLAFPVADAGAVSLGSGSSGAGLLVGGENGSETDRVQILRMK